MKRCGLQKARYEGRSANGEIIYLTRKAIDDFEKKTARSNITNRPDKYSP